MNMKKQYMENNKNIVIIFKWVFLVLVLFALLGCVGDGFQVSLYSDRQVYHSNETVHLTLEVVSPRGAEGELRLSGIKNLFGVDTFEKRVSPLRLREGENTFEFEFETPSCDVCSTVEPGEHWINASLLVGGRFFNSSLRITLLPDNATGNASLDLENRGSRENLSSVAGNGGSLEFDYFYDPGCPHCIRASPVVERVAGDYQGKVVFRKYLIKSREGMEKAREYGVREIPTVVIGGSLIGYRDYQDNLTRLESLLREEIERQLSREFIRIVKLAPRNPTRGELVWVNVTLENQGDRELDVRAWESYRGNVEFVDGRDSWQGWLAPGGQASYSYRVKILGPGRFPVTHVNYSGDGVSGSQVGEGASYVLQPSLSLLSVLGLGVLAGFNPCLFAILAFIASITLASTGRRRNVLYIVVLFSLGIFVTYLLTGLGLLKVMEGRPGLQIRTALVVLIALLGGWQLYDAYTLRFQGRSSFKTPEFFVRLTENMTRKVNLPAAFFLGSLFSLIKAPCVGAVYFAILDMVLGGERLKGVFYLGVYNLGVVLPVLLIGLAIAIGLDPEHVDRFRKERRSDLRLATGLSLIAIAVLMQFRII